MPPGPAELKAYSEIHSAAARDDAQAIETLAQRGTNLESRDTHGRTPLLVAAHFRCHSAARMLLRMGADARAVEFQRYDTVTIAAVNNDVRMLRIALKHGGDARAVTSPYDGTALIAAAHRGNVDVVKELIKAGAPLDHVNNLGWTAALETVILGDGGLRHAEILSALIAAGANVALADRSGATPLEHARRRGYVTMVQMLEEASQPRLIRP